jgi:hypothetical protein
VWKKGLQQEPKKERAGTACPPFKSLDPNYSPAAWVGTKEWYIEKGAQALNKEKESD